jgi:N-methylhydantoinase A
VCYGHPEAREITVTDANLLLGRLHADHFLGGRMKLDVERTRSRMQALARRLSLPLEAAAWGVLRVANSNMERAIRTISVERGHDPRRFTLVAFGGAGPLHACELAETLRIPRVLVPPHPGVLSALGMALADVVKDYSRTVMLPVEAADQETLDDLFAPLRAQARADLAAEGFDAGEVTLLPALDARYVGQSFELTIPLDGDGPLAARFHTAHLQRFAYASEGEPVEIVNVRLKAIGHTAKPHVALQAEGGVSPDAAHIGYKQVHFAGTGGSHAARPVPAALYDRERLAPGNIIVGPAVVFQLDTTTVLPPGWSATVDGWGNLVARGREP